MTNYSIAGDLEEALRQLENAGGVTIIHDGNRIDVRAFMVRHTEMPGDETATVTLEDLRLLIQMTGVVHQ